LNPFQQAAHIGNHRDTADFPILRAGYRVAQDRDFAFLKVTISSVDASRFAFAATTVGQKFNEVGAFLAPGTIGFSDGHNQFRKLFLARKLQKFLANLFPLNVDRRVVIPCACLNGDVQN